MTIIENSINSFSSTWKTTFDCTWE